jgi:hypothetical protein
MDERATMVRHVAKLRLTSSRAKANLLNKRKSSPRWSAIATLSCGDGV